MLADAFVGKEEEDFIFLDGAAAVTPELIVFEGSLRRTHVVEIVTGIQRIVAEKLESFTMVFVGARARGDIDDGASIAAILRRKCGIIHFEFFQRVYRWLKGDLVLHGIVQVDAIYEPVGGVFALAGGIDGKRTLPAQRRGE